MRRARSVTDLTLDVRQRLFGGPDPVPRRAPVAHDVARDASRLVMAVRVEERLVGGGVLGGLPLGVLALVAPLAFRGTDVGFMEPFRIVRERRGHARLCGIQAADLVIEPVHSASHDRIVRDVLAEPVVLDRRRRDPATRVQSQLRAAQPVVVDRRIENERPADETRGILIVQLDALAHLTMRRSVFVGGDDHVDSRAFRDHPADRGGREPTHDHDEVRPPSPFGESAPHGLDWILDRPSGRLLLEQRVGGADARRLEEADHVDPQPARAEHGVGGGDRKTVLSHVRDEVRGLHVLRHAPEIGNPERHLVHPDRGGAVAHGIHDSQIEPLFLFGEEVRPPLVLGPAEEAPGIQKEDVRMLAAKLIQYCGAAGHPTRLVDLAATRLEKARAVPGIDKGQTANGGTSRWRGTRPGGRQREIRFHRRERAAAREIAPEESPQLGTARQRRPKRRSDRSSIERGQDAIEAARPAPRRAELVVEMDQDEGRELRAGERRALGARIEDLEVLLDAAGVETGQIALGEAAAHIIIREPAGRGDRPP